MSRPASGEGVDRDGITSPVAVVPLSIERHIGSGDSGSPRSSLGSTRGAFKRCGRGIDPGDASLMPVASHPGSATTKRCTLTAASGRCREGCGQPPGWCEELSMCPTVTVPLQIDRAATRLTVPAQSYRETRRHTTRGGETLPRMVDVSSGRHPPFNFSHGPRTRSGATGPSRSDRLHLDAGNDQLGDRLGPRDAGVVEAGLTLDLAVLVGPSWARWTAASAFGVGRPFVAARSRGGPLTTVASPSILRRVAITRLTRMC
jgi:hypothetical protein